MNTTYTYIIPIVLAVSLHAGAVAMLLLSWQQDQAMPTTKIEPYYIEAHVVRLNPHRVRQEREQKLKVQQRKLVKQRQQARDHQARIDKQLLEQQRKQAAEQKARLMPEEAIPTQPAEKDTLELERLAAEQEAERLLMEQSMIVAIANEQKYRKAVTDDEKAMAYVAKIQREIINNWSRPPSARNGMRALLRVFLEPTGEVVNVALEESSGNDAFDRSAILAVRKAERFIVPSDAGQFEKNFREFEVLFRPNDLRL